MNKIFTCKQCNKEFEKNVSASTTAPGQTTTLEFCSRSCSAGSRRTSVDVTCLFCKKTFKVWPSRLKTKKFCSIKCYGGQQSVDRKGIVVNPGGTPWNKGKKNPRWAKENNPNWSGGVTKANDLIRKSDKYKEWRKAVFERDNYTCQICSAKGSEKNVTLNADHISPFALYPNLRFDIDNGRTLCVECHRATDTFGWGTRKLMPSYTARQRRLN